MQKQPEPIDADVLDILRGADAQRKANGNGIADADDPGPAEPSASKAPARPAAKPPIFEVLGNGRYRLTVPAAMAVLDVDRLRRDRHELMGELSVRSELPSARTVDGAISIADFNLSSARARQDRAKLLAHRSRSEADWLGFIEELCHRVLEADRAGDPATDLRLMARPKADDAYLVEGFQLPRRHPTILFGDGGAAKSYLALFFLGRLAELGARVALFDWELAPEDHRERLERLFFDGMPSILYARCERPLVHEVDRLSRIVRDGRIEYMVFDSIAFACDGPPEAAEVAGRYFRAVRELGNIGSLHIAHINKSEGGDRKPFGSTFWHNGARSTWFAKRNESSDAGALTVGLFHKKSNLGPLKPPIGYKMQFTEGRTAVSRTDVRNEPELSDQMSVRQRMASVLRSGALDPAELARDIESNKETVGRIVRRHKDQFILLQGGKVGLCHKGEM